MICSSQAGFIAVEGFDFPGKTGPKLHSSTIWRPQQACCSNKGQEHVASDSWMINVVERNAVI